jgi:hypothetical protein
MWGVLQTDERGIGVYSQKLGGFRRYRPGFRWSGERSGGLKISLLPLRERRKR